MTTKKREIIGSISSAIRLFAALSAVGLLMMLITCCGEFIFNMHAPGISGHAGMLLLDKLLNECMWWLTTSLWFLPFFIICYLFSERLAVWTFSIIVSLSILIEAMLVKYFSTALVPLGADLYGYSWKDIKQTLGASGGLNAGTIILFTGTVVLLIFSLRWVYKHVRIPLLPALLLPLFSIIAFIAGPSISEHHPDFPSDFAANLVLSKPAYFFRQTRDHFFPEENDLDIYADYYSGDAGDPQNGADGAAFSGISPDFRYPDETDFPFFHEDSAKDVLTPFFGKPRNTRAPNIVILLVEGLGRAFTNQGAYLGNFTPFVDSLARQSLYWENFLSEGGRTFAVLPSVLGSLPFGKNGFLEMGEAMPNHLSLLNILHKDGYHTSFYYGGDAHFDNMDLFLQKNRIDELNDGKSFPAGYTKLPSINGFTWGYNDKELFRRYLDTRTGEPAQPQLSVILTVSTHSPFSINEPEKYDRLFEDRMNQLGFDEPAKKEHRGFKDQYTSILYTDDALRGFFAAYSKRPDFKNTIFLVTGDHRMPEIPMRTKIDRYHVPLIVYSPMLQRSAEFLSVSTHFDITPSLLSFLSRSYGLERPDGAQWIGTGLDTAHGFRNIHAYPMIQTKTDQVDFIMGEYHLNGSQIFRLLPDMSEEPLTDERTAAQKERLQNGFAKWKRRNEQIRPGAKIIPDSLAKKYP